MYIKSSENPAAQFYEERVYLELITQQMRRNIPAKKKKSFLDVTPFWSTRKKTSATSELIEISYWRISRRVLFWSMTLK